MAARAAAARRIGGRVRSAGSGVQLPGLRARPRDRACLGRLMPYGSASGVAGGRALPFDAGLFSARLIYVSNVRESLARPQLQCCRFEVSWARGQDLVSEGNAVLASTG